MNVNLGATLTGNDEARFAQLSWATSVSHPVGESVDAFLEAFGQGPDTSGGRYFVGLDGGFIVHPNNDLQCDIFYAKGLSSFDLDW